MTPAPSPVGMHIHHVQLAAPADSEELARAFFVGVLQMGEVPKPSALRSRGGCWFRSGSCSVHIGIDPSFMPQRKAHPAFSVPDINGLVERLEAAGHQVRWDETMPNVTRFYTDDPFGNRLEFIAADDEREGADNRAAL